MTERFIFGEPMNTVKTSWKKLEAIKYRIFGRLAITSLPCWKTDPWLFLMAIPVGSQQQLRFPTFVTSASTINRLSLATTREDLLSRDDYSRKGFDELLSNKVASKGYTDQNDEAASFVLTNDFKIYGIGAANDGADLNTVDHLNADKIYTTPTDPLSYTKERKFTPLTHTEIIATSRTLMRLAKEAVPLDSGVILVMNNGDAYEYIFRTGAVEKFSNIVKAHVGNNYHLFLQANEGESDCSNGCTVIPSQLKQC